MTAVEIVVSIADNIAKVIERVDRAARKTGRTADDIQIVAVSKTHPPEMILEAIQNGIRHIGENKVQEAEAKFLHLREIAPDLEFSRHFIGHLQTNKVNKALQLFDFIQSVDSEKLADKISQSAGIMDKTIEILVQINTSAEDSKFGIEPDAALKLVEYISKLPHLKVKGLMTIGAFLPNPEQVRPCFVKLRELSDRIAAEGFPGVEMKSLSMGMTNDFEAAIEESANIVRIGTAIFGPREY